jgi:hypothetical protein
MTTVRLRRQHFAVLVLVAVPVVAFVVAAAVGHMSINGDNGIQNFPLRVLAAKDLDSGHLPLWDPYIWGGTPLLASFSAGATYPLTLLFAILPSLPAWVLTQIALYALVSVGTFVFFRSSGRSVAAAMAAAASFSFAGFMSSQIGHVDAIEAAVWVPWLLFAVRRIAFSEHHRGLWTGLLGIGVSIVVVAGSPNTFIDDFIAVGFYAIWLCIRHRDRAGRTLGLTLAAGVVGGLLAAVLWAPGLAWESMTQRFGESYGFVSTGSLPPRLTILSVLPWLIGGNGNFGTGFYAGPYNLTELNGYIGLLPLMAACGLLASRFRHHRQRGDWLGWYVLVVLGLILAWGGDTPIGHVLYAIPYYGQLRDQSRNLLLVDLGLAGLLASWIDVAILPLRAGQHTLRLRRTEETTRDTFRLRRTEVVWTLLPVIGVLVVWGYFLANPGSVAFRLEAVSLTHIGAQKLDLTISALIALCAAAAVIGASRLGQALRISTIGAVIAVDLLVYGAQQYTFWTTPTSLLKGTTPQEAQLAAIAGPGRRIAFEDPAMSPNLNDLELGGLPDDNIIEGVSSINGYGTLIGATYDRLTDTHAIATISLTAIADGVLDQLDVGVLVTPGPTLGPPQAGLSAALGKGRWVPAGSLGEYALWRPTQSFGAVWSYPASPSTKFSDLRQGRQDAWSATISTAAPTEVVRSVAFAPGWSAVLSAASGTSQTVPVVRDGLVQAVRVPAGVTHISWVYNAPSLRLGIALTALGALVAAGMAIADPALEMLEMRRKRA